MTGLIPSKTSPNTSFMVLISDSFRIRIAIPSCGGLVSIPLARVRLGSVFGKESPGTKIEKGSKKIRGYVYILFLSRDGSQMVEGKFCYLASRVYF